MVVMLHVLVPIQAFIYVAQVSSILICTSTLYTLFSINWMILSVSDDATISKKNCYIIKPMLQTHHITSNLHRYAASLNSVPEYKNLLVLSPITGASQSHILHHNILVIFALQTGYFIATFQHPLVLNVYGVQNCYIWESWSFHCFQIFHLCYHYDI